MIKVKQKISGAFRTKQGADTLSVQATSCCTSGRDPVAAWQ